MSGNHAKLSRVQAADLDRFDVDLWRRHVQYVKPHELPLYLVSRRRGCADLIVSCGSTSARRSPINEGSLHQFNVGPRSVQTLGGIRPKTFEGLLQSRKAAMDA